MPWLDVAGRSPSSHRPRIHRNRRRHPDQPNSVKVLRALSVYERLATTAFRPEALEMRYDRSGLRISSASTSPEPLKHAGAQHISPLSTSTSWTTHHRHSAPVPASSADGLPDRHTFGPRFAISATLEKAVGEGRIGSESGGACSTGPPPRRWRRIEGPTKSNDQCSALFRASMASARATLAAWVSRRLSICSPHTALVWSYPVPVHDRTAR
ncbi:hypothetical protein NONO_c36930 [Nocardia nova SH22a]|uniref:Uncharacterized protein n=1 Tax=Nocardia nova SH22a TaxID=1415166 RepID=W5TGK5_9NOCA|nr:hypothetical protein NONO_c36930 [Nocardia nova SH22a]